MSSRVYQPRSRRAELSETFDEIKRGIVRFAHESVMRGAGGLLLLVALLGYASLLFYHPADASLNNATAAAPNNLLGGLGAAASDLLFQAFGLAALAFLASPAVWGLRALFGQKMRHGMPRLIAWFLGTVLTAAGLGVLPAPLALPAGCGGMIGITVTNLSAHVGQVYGIAWIGTAVPLILLAIGLPLAFLATGLEPRGIVSALAGIPAGFIWLKGLVRMPERAHDYDHEPEDDYAVHDDDEEDDADAYGLAVAPEPVAASSSSPSSAKPRVRREETRKADSAKTKTAHQPVLAFTSGEYELPSLGLLTEAVRQHDATALSDEALEENARMLEAVLGDFGVKGRITAVRPGPVVTLYEFEPAAGVKSSRVISLSDDVARSMSAVAARIAVIPGRNVIGIELPNQNRETVFLRELLSANEYEKARAPLTLALGKTIGGEPVMADLAKMPHLLIAGTTGSGKSVGLNTMILSLLYRMSPEHCRMIMIDPKMLELSVYEGIPHLLAPVVTEPRKAVVALKWAVREMEERYRKMSKLGVRGVEAFNDRVRKAKDKGETLKRTVQTGFDRETGKPIYEDEMLELEPMPYIVLIVDEVADLMMISGKEIEGAVQRLAQMARAAGIHLIAATQRPSVDVITGTIKANFPTRISFQVTSKIDSRTILGEQGAEQLLGQGDMLYMMAGGRIRRIHGPFVTDAEVEDVVRFLKTQGRPDYLDAVTEEPDEDGDDPYGLSIGGEGGDDLFDKAVAIVARERKVSTSY
ncbi:MAG TPA: DNA translocase FtsK 4TM domain-containing protein, partial [Rhizomicrobium sp.]